MSVENGKEISLNGKSNGKGEKGDVSSVKKVELTDIFGGFGRFQILLGTIVMVSTILGNWNVIGYTFFTYPMDHWCARPEKYANVSVDQWKNLTIPKEKHHGVEGFSRCKMYDLSNYSNPDALMSSYENRDTSVEWKASSRLVGCGELEFDKSFFQSTILYQWSITCENSWMASMSQSVYMAGFLVAVLGFGQIGDKFGRRPVLLTCVALQQIAGFAAAFSPNFIFFVIMRFFIAMGTHGFYTTGFVVLMELVSSEMRPKMGVILSVGWSIGFILLPGLGWLTRNWSTLQLVIAICSMSLSVCWWFFPESPRWLVTQGKYKEAQKIIEKAAKMNKMYSDETPKMIEKFCELLELENQLNNTEKEKTQKASMIDLVRTPNMRKTTLNMFFAWFVTSFVYYGLSLNTHSLGGDPIVNIAIAGATEFPCLIIGYLAITYIGRRKPLTFFLVLAGGGCLLTIPITDDLLWLRITLVMIGKAGVSIAFGIVYIYSAELFPTVVRNVGVGSSSTCARVGSIIAPFVKELGKATNEGVPLAVFGGVTVFSGLMVLLLPETMNKPIPDTLEEGEIASTKKRKNPSSKESSGDSARTNQAFQTEEAKL